MGEGRRREQWFRLTKARTLTWAIGVGALCILILIVLELQKRQVPGSVYSAISNVVGVVLGVAVVSVIWETVLRRTQSEELLHFLQINASVQVAGLRSIGAYSEVNWQDELANAKVIQVSLRDTTWLQQNNQALLNLASRRPMSVTVFLPRSGSVVTKLIAEERGVASSDIDGRQQTDVKWFAQLWRDSDVKAGTKVSFREVETHLTAEVYAIDDKTIVALERPRSLSTKVDRIAVVTASSAGVPFREYFRTAFDIDKASNLIEEVSR